MSTSIPRLSIPIVLSGLMGAACGGPTFLDHSHETSHSVTHPSPLNLAQGKALAGSYIVAFRNESGGPGLAFASYEAEFLAHDAPLRDRAAPDPRIKDIQFIASVDLNPKPTGLWEPNASIPATLLASWDGIGHDPVVASIARVDFTDEPAAAELLGQWESDGRVWFAEPNWNSQLFVDPPTRLAGTGEFETIANNYKPVNDVAWGLKAIKQYEALESIAQRDQSKETPDTQILANPPVIAVLDSGVDYSHAVLQGRLWANPSPGSAGCQNDVHGCNTTVANKGVLGNGDVFPAGTSGPGMSCGGDRSSDAAGDQGTSDLKAIEACAHGTHVSGIIVGNADATTGLGGVCPVCKVLPVRIVSGDGAIYDSSILAAMKYITLFRQSSGGRAVRIVNASFGKFARSKAVGLLVRLLAEDGKGALVVGAAGNEDTMEMAYPAAFQDAIAVTSVTRDNGKSGFANFGRWVDIAAPGGTGVRDESSIGSIEPGTTQVSYRGGTSMAAPFVAGVAGLVIARYPNISFSGLRQALLGGADPAVYDPSVNGGINFNYYYPKIAGETMRQPLMGKGMLNALNSVNKTAANSMPDAALDRVTSSCGVLAHPRSDSSKHWWYALLLIPLGVSLGATRKRTLRRF